MIGHRPRPARIDAGLGDRSGQRGRGQFLAPPARRDRRAASLRDAGATRRAARPGRAGDGRCLHDLTRSGAARKRWPPAAAGAALIVGSALAFALDGPVAQAAYRQGLDPATFGFWRASAGALVLGGYLAARLRPGALAGIRRMRRPAAIRLALAAVAGLGLNLALFEAFARLPVAVAVASFGCHPLFVAAWEAVPPGRGGRGRAGHGVGGHRRAHAAHPPRPVGLVPIAGLSGPARRRSTPPTYCWDAAGGITSATAQPRS
jgi:hypothetical protein